MKKQDFIWLCIIVTGMIFAMILVGQLSKPNDELTAGQVLELAHQRALGFGLTENEVVKQPPLGRLEYSTICTFLPGTTKIVLCKEWTTIYYDDGRGVITLNPDTLKAVPQLLQGMPPGSLLYTLVVEESAKIDQMIFWVNQGRLYPEAANK